MSSAILSGAANHLWQSTAFALAVALLVPAFRKNRASVRYWLWLGASLKFLVPFALLIGAGNALWQAIPGGSVGKAIAPSAVSQAVGQMVEPFAESVPFVAAAPHASRFPWVFVALVGIWVCGVVAIVALRLRAWLRVRAAVRTAR